MYVSVTGLKPKSLMGYVRFWIFTIPAATSARTADGVLLCEFNSRNYFQHTLTVWKSKKKKGEAKVKKRNKKKKPKKTENGIGIKLEFLEKRVN